MNRREFPVRVSLTGAEFFELATRAESSGMKIGDYLKGLAFNDRRVSAEIVRKPSQEEIARSIAELIGLGYSNSEIGKRININRETIATQRARIEQQQIENEMRETA